MLGTKKKLKKKTDKKSTCTETTEAPKPVTHFTQLPPPVPGEKLLAALQEWKKGSQQSDLSNHAGESRLLERSRKDLKLVFKCVDSDNKGNLNFKAFQQLITGWHSVTRDFYSELKKGFSIIDFDKDGKITAADLREASKLAGIQFSNKQLEEMLQVADKDGDQAVDMIEFIEIMLKTNLF
ncbi:uncharacterized protein [Eleutherodactylus coqui]|uniref:uncharacterized protein isoform X2 n=1 Tax=Eleutherodactylus coqui TaxID=57060 RepID=UPI003461ADD4